MWLSDVSIKRPVLATVMSLLLILFGVMGLTRLSVREYPDIDPPVVSVTTVYPGASAEVIETTVTEPLEEELVSTEGIKTFVSNSQEQVSSIIIEFELSRDIDKATQDVRDRVARAQGELPDDVEDPLVIKQDSDAQAILWLTVNGDNFSTLQLTDYADRYLVDHFQTLPGVSRVIIGGEREYAMRLWLDPTQMAARGVTVLDVQDALRKENVEIPSGRIEGLHREFTIRTLGELQTPEAFNHLIVKTVNGKPIYLEDIGKAEIGARTDRSLTRFNGKPAIGLGIVKQSKANTLDVAHLVKARYEEVKKTLPAGMGMSIAYDSSLFIERSIEEVRDSLFLAGALVVIVIFLFLGNFRSTLIPAIAIPVSIVTTFFVMYMLNYSINTLTLLALTLAIGLVVDDTIVVLENIYRRIELGESVLEASINGTREIAFAVIATTVALVAVFVPLAFMTGVTGRLFIEFAIAVAGSVIISGFVALSLTPMLCSKLLKAVTHADPKTVESKEGPLQRFVNGFIYWVEQTRLLYESGLRWTMDHMRTVFVTLAIITVLSGISFVLLPKEFLPTEDRGYIISFISAPEGSTIQYTDQAVRKAEKILRETPEVKQFFSAIALGSASGINPVNTGIMFAMLQPDDKRSLKSQEVVGKILPQMMSIPEAMVFPIAPPSGPSRGSGKDIEMVVQGFDLGELSEYSNKILARAQKIPGFIRVENDLKMNKPEVVINVNREKAANLNVSVRDIASTLQILMGGLDLSTFKLNNKRYDVMVQLPPEFRLVPQQLDNIFVEGQEEKLIPLTNVIDYKESVTPVSLNHYSRLRSATISGNLIPIPGVSMGGVMEQLEKIAKEELPSHMRIAWAGQSKEFKLSQSSTMEVFLLAIFVVYLILAAQFESFVHPFVVMLTVPLAVCGALLTLLVVDALPFMNASLNVYSQIGIILLIGLVTKNGILIVEYANQQRELHPEYTAKQAVMEASMIRFRPILMTSIATIFGALPIALGVGAGSESRQPLGLAVVGGMVLSTLLALFVIPIAYELANRRQDQKNQTP